MKKFLSVLILLMTLTSCFVVSSHAKPRQRKRNAVFIGGGAATGARHRHRTARTRGVVEREQLEAVRKNRRTQKRIWVPQGSPALRRGARSGSRPYNFFAGSEVRSPGRSTNRCFSRTRAPRRSCSNATRSASARHQTRGPNARRIARKKLPCASYRESCRHLRSRSLS